MAELDLYGDLYGDVDDVGSPVALSPSQQAPPNNDPASGMQAEQRANAPSPPAGVPDHPMNNPPASQPTTFSISTYEDPSYANKQHNPTGQSDSPHPPRPSVDTNSASHTGPGSKVWGVKPSDMPDEGLVIYFFLSISDHSTSSIRKTSPSSLAIHPTARWRTSES
jgi:hypothetical protein